jgi:hypothetical protein
MASVVRAGYLVNNRALEAGDESSAAVVASGMLPLRASRGALDLKVGLRFFRYFMVRPLSIEVSSINLN